MAAPDHVAGLFVFAQNDFALAYQLVVEPQTIFVGGSFAAGAGRPAEQPHAGWRLKNVRGEGAAVYVEFHAQIARVGNPGDLVTFVDHHDLRDESNEYGTFSHVCDDNTIVAQISCDLSHRRKEKSARKKFAICRNEPVPLGI